ncbi:metalloregulator ArsR/SmtB family transcription factor [Schlegelella sp. S2-27]|uniref:Metalloregulator ArsR/SmtB family transcription factor n=1 Tax=Caldimonas mangrovi TaxID=2944811 RepID=A0ABT0YVH1_9BURK|nr:metalloregulator ArsR/SmtB family transcription factor [Caldimonas mangrovi]MCM5682740.1 metalloregulator ArsR/SmtB family transcription factor [Caldimonas mangrovi]
MDASRHFHALGDPTRRRIFEMLARQPRAVTELAAQLPVSRPAVSQHLKVLQDAGLVRFDRAGTRNIYGVDPDGLRAMRAYLDALWTEALGDLKALAESTHKPRPDRSRT